MVILLDFKCIIGIDVVSSGSKFCLGLLVCGVRIFIVGKVKCKFLLLFFLIVEILN